MASVISKKKRCRSKSVVRSRKRKLQMQERPIFTPRRPPQITTFECYVQSENFLSSDDHAQLFRFLNMPLPTCFRIRSPKINEDFKKRVRNGNVRASALPGIPGGWKISSEDEDYEMRKWLAINTKSGVVSRQEFVSM